MKTRRNADNHTEMSRFTVTTLDANGSVVVLKNLLARDKDGACDKAAEKVGAHRALRCRRTS